MKILYIHQYFGTPEEHGTSRSYWFAKKLIENGFNVTMVTATNEYKHREACRENVDGIDVIYVQNDYSQYYSRVKKVYSFLKFIFFQPFCPFILVIEMKHTRINPLL